MVKLGPYPTPGWSASRSSDLRACPRLYYYRTWGSWQGWTDDPRHPGWAAYRLKHVTGFRQQVGITAHSLAQEVVQTLVGGSDPPDFRELERRGCEALQRLRTATLADWLRHPKKNPILPETVFGGAEYVPRAYEEASEHLYACVTNLLDSDALDEISRCRPNQLLATDALDSIELLLPDGTTVTVWAAPDLAYRGPDDEQTVTIIDWKTGSTEAATAQLAVYALYVHHRFGVPLGSGHLRGRVVSLSPFDDIAAEVTAGDVDAAYQRIWSDVQETRSYTADPITNVPVERSLFPMVEGEDRKRCGYCAYRLLCDPERPSAEPRPSTQVGDSEELPWTELITDLSAPAMAADWWSIPIEASE
jgi:hypothetical protein